MWEKTVLARVKMLDLEAHMQQQKRRRVREPRARRVRHHDDANITRTVSHTSLVNVSVRTTHSAHSHLHAKCMFHAPFFTAIPCVCSWAQKMDLLYQTSFQNFRRILNLCLHAGQKTSLSVGGFRCRLGGLRQFSEFWVDLETFDNSGEHFRPSFIKELLLGLFGNFVAGARSTPFFYSSRLIGPSTPPLERNFLPSYQRTDAVLLCI